VPSPSSLLSALTLKKKAVQFSETLGRIFPVIECNILEDFNLHDGSSWSSARQYRPGKGKWKCQVRRSV